MEGNKKIAFILGSMFGGGAERVVSHLANYYADKGWDVSILMLLSPRVGYKLNSTIKLIDFSGDTESRIRRVPYWTYSIRNYVTDNDIRYIVSFAARINLITLIALQSEIKCRRLIISERIDPGYDHRNVMVKTLIDIYYPRAAKIIFQTKRSLSYFNYKVLNKGEVIGNPVDVSTFAIESEKRKKKIVTMGRLVSQKNHSMLIRAFARIYREFSDYSLWIYGEGELRNELERLIENLKLKGCVYLPGNVEDVHERIKDAEIFVLPSNYEGLSNALLEAMMMGLPCISTDCAGSDEVITQKENGLLIAVGDENQMYYAIKYMITHPKERNEMGEKAKKSVEKFRTDIIIEKWVEAIEGK